MLTEALGESVAVRTAGAHAVNARRTAGRTVIERRWFMIGRRYVEGWSLTGMELQTEIAEVLAELPRSRPRYL